MMQSSKKTITAISVSYIVLFIIWSLSEILLMPFMIRQLSESDAELIKEVIFKIMIWLIPAVLLCRHYSNFLTIQNKDWFSLKVKWLKVLPILFLFTVFHLISAYVRNGNIAIAGSFRMTDIPIAISVGIAEEMVFRGWLLNVSMHDKKWTSIIINAVLFLLIHFPVWIRHNMLCEYIINGSFLQIIILSIIFSYAFIKSKNILIPILLHTYWDFLCFIL